jgi:Leucine-rich repeat (LRR) protein
MRMRKAAMVVTMWRSGSIEADAAGKVRRVSRSLLALLLALSLAACQAGGQAQTDPTDSVDSSGSVAVGEREPTPAAGDGAGRDSGDSGDGAGDEYSAEDGEDGARGADITAALTDPEFLALIRGYRDKGENEPIYESDAATFGSLDFRHSFVSNISSLAGIEYFKNLTYLDCSRNKLLKLDLSANTALNVVICERSQLESLILPASGELTLIDCSENRLTSLDVSALTGLANLDCSGNLLTELDLAANAALEELDCSDNQITTLRLADKPKLESLSCIANRLPALDVSGCAALLDLWCYGNQLAELDLSANGRLIYLDCSDNRLSSLKLSQNPALAQLTCDDNQLRELSLTANPELYYLACDGNRLTELDLTANAALASLACSNNQLASVSLPRGDRLRTVRCSGNRLTVLDVSGNPGLTGLWCEDNQLGSLTASGSAGLMYLYCRGNALATEGDIAGVALSDLRGYQSDFLPGESIDWATIGLLPEDFILTSEGMVFGDQAPFTELARQLPFDIFTDLSQPRQKETPATGRGVIYQRTSSRYEDGREYGWYVLSYPHRRNASFEAHFVTESASQEAWLVFFDLYEGTTWRGEPVGLGEGQVSQTYAACEGTPTGAGWRSVLESKGNTLNPDGDQYITVEIDQATDAIETFFVDYCSNDAMAMMDIVAFD